MKTEFFEGWNFIFLIVVLSLFFYANMNFVGANVLLGNKSFSIGLSYGTSKPITGWINISLVNEPADSMLRMFNKNLSFIINLLISSIE